jgi:hypothetical protein
MIKIKPHQKESLLKNIRKPTVKEEYDKSHFVISFKHLDRNQGQTFKEWEAEKILARAVNTLSGYCHNTLQAQCHTDNFTAYGNFPPKDKTDFVFPNHVPQDAEWASMHITGKQCLVGHIFRNIFYVVFLDKNHKFWKVEKKRT